MRRSDVSARVAYVADKFFAAHYQVVRVDVLEDGTVRMGKLSSVDEPPTDGAGESHRRNA